MADRWFRFEAEEHRGERRIVLHRRGEPETGNKAIDLWRDPGTVYGLQGAGELPTLPALLLGDLLDLLPAEVVETELRRRGHAPRSAVMAMVDAVDLAETRWAHGEDAHEALSRGLSGLTGEPVDDDSSEEVDDG